MQGRPFAQRVTFVINKQGTVARIFAPVKNAGGHPQEVLDYVKSDLAPKK
jgi:peroxiredoxin